jgi:hypothetical protein
MRRCLTPIPMLATRINATPNVTAAPSPASPKSNPEDGFGTLIAVSPTVALPMFLL